MNRNIELNNVQNIVFRRKKLLHMRRFKTFVTSVIFISKIFSMITRNVEVRNFTAFPDENCNQMTLYRLQRFCGDYPG
jgi:hypothetical protein